MYNRLAHSRIRGELGFHAYLGIGLIKKLFCHVYTSDALPYTGGTRNPRLLAARNYLNNYFAMYKSLTLSRISVELLFPACLSLGII